MYTAMKKKLRAHVATKLQCFEIIRTKNMLTLPLQDKIFEANGYDGIIKITL